MTAVDARRATAHEEAGHLLAGQYMGRTARGLWLADDGSCVQFEDAGNVSPDATIFTTVAGPVAKALHLDPTWRDFEGLAEHLLSGVDNDGRSVLLCFEQKAQEEGRRFTRQQALRIVAGRAERARKLLTEKAGEVAQIVEDALAGKLQPRAYPEGAKLAYANGKPLGYVQQENMYAAGDDGGPAILVRGGGVIKFADTRPPKVDELPIVDPFLAEAVPEQEAKPKKALRLIRDSMSRLVGIEETEE
jgi:hypothetical protein